MLLVLLYFKHYAYQTHNVFLLLSPICQLPLLSQKYARNLLSSTQNNTRNKSENTNHCYNDSKVNTTLDKHRPSQPNVLKNCAKTLQHLLLIIFNNPQNSKRQHYAPLYDYFFRNQNYFKELKQTHRPSLTAHILYVINVIILQNKSTIFTSTTPLTNDSQFSDRSLNLSA